MANSVGDLNQPADVQIVDYILHCGSRKNVVGIALGRTEEIVGQDGEADIVIVSVVRLGMSVEFAELLHERLEVAIRQARATPSTIQ